MKNYFPSDLRVIAKLIGANLNVTADQALALQIADADNLVTTLAGNFILDKIVVTNASISLTTAAGGVYTAASKGGTAVVAAGQVYTALTASTKFVALTLANSALTDVLNLSNLYFSLTTAQGAAATADIYVYGRLFQKN
jgi:hypothetical protein